MKANGHMQVSPTLIVGLGGTGSLGVQYAKRKIRKQLKKYAKTAVPEKIPFVEYLVMDTTSQEQFVEEFDGDELLHLGHINVPQILSGLSRNSSRAEVLNWFPKHINPGQIDSGARGVRHIGRLCFFERFPQIDGSIRHKLHRITEYTSVDKDLREHFQNLNVRPGSTVDVHIISSLCGGTGSACLLDTAYLIRDIVYELLKQGTNTTAHLVTTEPFISDTSINATSREYIQYNFAIALSEIERFMNFDIDTNDVGSNKSGWEVKYLNGQIVTSLEKPFNVTYLLGCKEGESIRKKNICEIIGDTISLQTAHREGSILKGLVDNAKAHVINQKDTFGKIRAYSSYNTRILSAEFSEQTVEASTHLASKAILDTLCANGTAPGGDAVLKDLRDKTHWQSEDKKLVFELTKDEFNKMYAAVETEIGIQKDRFMTIQQFLDKPGKSGGWFNRRGRDRSLEDKIDYGRKQFETMKESCAERSQRVIREFEEWRVMVRREFPGKVHEFLHNGERLTTVAKSLRSVAGDINDISTDLDVRKRNIEQDGEGSWIEMSIKHKQYADKATARLRYEIMTPVYNTFKTGLGELKEFVITLAEKCESAEKCLDDTRKLMKERSSRSSSLTESSIWTQDKVGAKITEKTDVLVSSFITELVRKYPEADKETDPRIAFLWRLDRKEEKQAEKVRDLLRDVARGVVKDKIQIEEIDFNRNEGDAHQDVISGEDVNRFIALAAPAWQIDRAGEDIAEISITNCPGETKLGKVISKMSNSITFSEGNPDDNQNQIIVFRSEHGISADRLLNLDSCMEAVRRKLVIEEKPHISDLSLNQAWQIEEPGTAQTIELLYAYFSLGHMFGEIVKSTDAEFFFLDKDNKVNGEHPKIILSSIANSSQSVERSKAFSMFVRLSSKRDKKVVSLTDRIDQLWGERKRTDMTAFMTEVATHIKALESERTKRVEATGSSAAQSEVVQIEKEIAALQNRVIRPIEDHLKFEQANATRVAKGQAAGQSDTD